MERNFHFYAYFVCFDDKPVWLIILWLHLHSNSVKTVETPKREVQFTKTNVYLFLALALHQQIWWCYKVANEANVLLHKLKLKAFAAYLANGSNFAVSAKSPFILSPITSDAQKAYHGLDFWIGTGKLCYFLLEKPLLMCRLGRCRRCGTFAHNCTGSCCIYRDRKSVV